MKHLELKQLVISEMHEIAEQNFLNLIDTLEDNTVLLESGLDSMCFAALVVRLEILLEIDPFADSNVSYYPSTLIEFVNFYFSKMQKNAN